MGNKAKPISLNILDIAQRVNQLEKSGGGSGGGGAADDVTYDPTASGLQATNVQDAIDEVSGEISGLSADDVTYDNTDSGLSSETVQGAIDETVNKIDFINDDLNGFKFYPVGTAIVGLVSDDSPYTDANGNYILAASTTGQSMIDGVTYKSINSTVDARGKVGADSATPFKSGGSDEEPTLLWTNFAPTNDFAAQTVSLDLSDYKSVCIEYLQNNVSSIPVYPKVFYAVGDSVSVPAASSPQQTFPGGAFGMSGTMMSTTRDLTITTTGINFGTGYTNNVTGAANAIPLHIWGIKAQIYPTNI